jgi:hypothetical protein
MNSSFERQVKIEFHLRCNIQTLPRAHKRPVPSLILQFKPHKIMKSGLVLQYGENISIEITKLFLSEQIGFL